MMSLLWIPRLMFLFQMRRYMMSIYDNDGTPVGLSNNNGELPKIMRSWVQSQPTPR